MNTNHTAIRVMKQAAVTPDRSDLSEQGGRGQALGRWLVDSCWACSLPCPWRTKALRGGGPSTLTSAPGAGWRKGLGDTFLVCIPGSWPTLIPASTWW